ncbi:MAG: DUF4126 domain-containing protein [Nitriliruptorales bacterium]|nr:DUF4126 domain-containing protein [Nitriliruptorales bacterium]
MTPLSAGSNDDSKGADIETIGLIAGSGWASGINLYGVGLLLGLFGRFGLAEVPEILSNPVTIGVFGVLYLVEFVADKIPYLDNVWDAVHTVIRPLGAAALGYLLAGDIEGASQAASAGGSGLLALASHSTKATARAAINASPEPASNIVVSLLEDGLVATVVWFALEYPVAALGAVVVLLLAGGVVIVLAFKAARGIFHRVRARLSGEHSSGCRSRKERR